MNDCQLSARHIRLLAVIAWHHRMGNRGCYARAGVLAKEADLDPTNIARLVRDIEEFGYVEAGRNPKSQRVRSIFVIYKGNSAKLGADTKLSEPVDEIVAETVSIASNLVPVPSSLAENLVPVPTEFGEIAQKLGTALAVNVDIIEQFDQNILIEPNKNSKKNRCSETAALTRGAADKMTQAQEPQLGWLEVCDLLGKHFDLTREQASSFVLEATEAEYAELASPTTSEQRLREIVSTMRERLAA